MPSALISSEHDYPAFALGRTAGTPEVRLSWSSRTKDISLQTSLRPHWIETDNFVTSAYGGGSIISVELCISLCSSDYIFPSLLQRAWRIVSEGLHRYFDESSLLIIPTEELLLIRLTSPHQYLQMHGIFQQIAKFKDSNGLTVSRRSEPNSRTLLTGEQPDPWDLLQPQDRMSRHRGAKPRCRYELSSAISLLSPEYLLFVERWHSH